MPQAARASDFSHYYLSCRMLLEGRSPYATLLDSMAKEYGLGAFARTRLTGTNPPVLQWLFAPFAMLTPQAAFWLWSLLQAAALGVILWLTRLLLAGRLTTRAWRFVACGAVASVPMLIHFTEVTDAVIDRRPVAGGPGSAPQRTANRRMPDRRRSPVFLKLFPFVLLPWFVWRGGRTWRAARRPGRHIARGHRHRRRDFGAVVVAGFHPTRICRQSDTGRGTSLSTIVWPHS